MRSATTTLAALLLLAPAALALPVTSPACGDPLLAPLCIEIIIGDVVVGNGQEEEMNNATFVMQGSVTVEDGGRLEIIASTVAVGEEAQPIHVQAGGTLVIEGSTLTAVPDGSSPVILAEEGAHVEVQASDFTGLTLHIRTDDADIGSASYNSFTLGAPAIRLEGFDGTLPYNEFARNVVGVNATGGSPLLYQLTFREDTLAIELYDTNADVDAGTFVDVTNAVRAVASQGTYSNSALDDRSLPPTIGFEILDTTGTTTLSGNSISEFGTGVYYCRADVTMVGNFFANNGEDVVTC